MSAVARIGLSTAPPLAERSPDPLAQLLIYRISKDKIHPEYQVFEGQFGPPKIRLAPANAIGRAAMRTQFSVWDLINDSIDGTGGYVDGSYLIPHELEFDPAQPSGLARKFLERMEIARYDNFAQVICEGPWHSITSMQDVIVRDSGTNTRLEQFWGDVDGDGTDIIDFLAYPVSQARRFGTAWIFIDREEIGPTLRDDTAQPYAFCVPTRNVIWWKFDGDGSLQAVAYRDPDDEEDEFLDADPQRHCPIRIWTTGSWSTWEPIEGGAGFTLAESGLNMLGEVPCVQLFDGAMTPGHAFGSSNMLGIARMALDCYNRDSEIREIERRTAFPMLHVSIGDLSQASLISVGTNGVLATDGKVAPSWLEPGLQSIDKLASEREAVKDAAFVMSEMTGLLGHTKAVQTSSGYHSEVELDKSERRIGRLAASVEAAENKIARLFLAMVGAPDQDYGVSYPRKFGMVDTDTMIVRTRDRLALNLGNADSIEVLKDYYNALYPRKTAKEIEAMAHAAAAARAAAAPLTPVQIPGGPLANKPVPNPDQDGTPQQTPVQTARQRLGMQAKTPPAAPPAGKAAA